jgi:hypothetical protein
VTYGFKASGRPAGLVKLAAEWSLCENLLQTVIPSPSLSS